MEVATFGRAGGEMESEVETFRAWFAYLADTRRGYIETLAKLAPTELTRDRGASYPSLLDIFAHSQGALFFWMKSCATFPFPAQEGDPDAPASIEAVRKDETYVQAQVQRVMAELTYADLSREIVRPKGGRQDHDCRIPVREALWHLVEEELQHRGELNALLWQIDVEAPVVSWIRWGHANGRIEDRPA
ncbi:MAG TPA: DinB family protein [Thermoplasmata archaeon]|nr:DinB family protein [Thermoplasmata archaeon]